MRGAGLSSLVRGWLSSQQQVGLLCWEKNKIKKSRLSILGSEIWWYVAVGQRYCFREILWLKEYKKLQLQIKTPLFEPKIIEISNDYLPEDQRSPHILFSQQPRSRCQHLSRRHFHPPDSHWGHTDIRGLYVTSIQSVNATHIVTFSKPVIRGAAVEHCLVVGDVVYQLLIVKPCRGALSPVDASQGHLEPMTWF